MPALALLSSGTVTPNDSAAAAASPTPRRIWVRSAMAAVSPSRPASSLGSAFANCPLAITSVQPLARASSITSTRSWSMKPTVRIAPSDGVGPAASASSAASAAGIRRSTIASLASRAAAAHAAASRVAWTDTPVAFAASRSFDENSMSEIM